MTGTRLSTRTEIKDNLAGIYSSINDNKPSEALDLMDSLELNITVYFNTRGFECSQLIPIMERIRNLLRKGPKRSHHKRQIYTYIFELTNKLRASSFSTLINKTEKVDPILCLRYVADDLIDDYSAFNPTTGGQEVVEQNRAILELIKDDLLEMREFEPLFKQQPESIQQKYNVLTKQIHICLMILPQAKDITLSANTAKAFREKFEFLFSVLTDMFIPVEQKAVEEETEEDEKETVEPKAKKKSVEKEIPIDFSELERRAKEGTLNGSTAIPQ